MSEKMRRAIVWGDLASPSINAHAVFTGDVRECRRLHAQFVEIFNSDFDAILSYYQWKRESMLKALERGAP